MNKEPLESSSRRRGSPKEARQITHDRIIELEEAEEKFEEKEDAMTGSLDTGSSISVLARDMQSYEVVELASNAIIVDMVQNLGEGETDLAITGAIRRAIQLLHDIGREPQKHDKYEELRVLLRTLETYTSSDA